MYSTVYGLSVDDFSAKSHLAQRFLSVLGPRQPFLTLKGKEWSQQNYILMIGERDDS
jgi:hypothetical protein